MNHDLAGIRYGRWVVVSSSGKNNNGRDVWKCRCDCGTEKQSVIGLNLRSGLSTSCGCLQRERSAAAKRRHGHCDGGRESLSHASWRAMLSRCINCKDASYKFYGARGITVCDRWHVFENFLEDMGERPVGMEIDRVDNSQGYAPGNCRWVTHKQNGRNTRTNRVIDTPDGEMLLCEASELSGINFGTLLGRIRRNWPVSRVFDAPRPINRGNQPGVQA